MTSKPCELCGEADAAVQIYQHLDGDLDALRWICHACAKRIHEEEFGKDDHGLGGSFFIRTRYHFNQAALTRLCEKEQIA